MIVLSPLRIARDVFGAMHSGSAVLLSIEINAIKGIGHLLRASK
jgi:hypothetical protein